MQEPIIVAYYSTIKQTITKRYYIVGSTDKNKSVSELSEKYGRYVKAKEQELLAMFSVAGSSTHTISGIAGGADATTDDLFADIDLDAAFDVEPEVFSLKETLRAQQQSTTSGALLPSYTALSKSLPNEIITSEVRVYPFDRLYDLAQKISIITGIPYYRLHMDYIDPNGGVKGTYKLFAGGPYDTSITTYKPDGNNITLSNGIFVDKYVYDIKTDTKVYVTDTFSVAQGIKYILVSDLNEILSLIQLDDQYKIDLVYYGIVLKYWPQITTEVFKDYIQNESRLGIKYPELARDMVYIKSQYQSERQHLGNINPEEEAHIGNILTSIGRCLVSGSAPGPLNLRNIFDSLATNESTSRVHIPEIHYFIKDGSKTVQLTKLHHGLRSRGIPNQQVLKNGVTVLITKGIDVMYFALHPNGKWYFKAVFAEEDFMTFDKIKSFVESYVHPIIATINKIGLKGSPAGPIVIKDLEYDHISAGLFWKKIITETQFKELIKSMDEYVTAGVIGQYNIINTVKDSQLYIFKKGTYQFDGTLIDRVLIKAGKGELKNQFNYLVNPLVRSKWIELYSGRVIRVTHRSSDIYIEIQDAQQQEFIMFKGLITHILRKSGIKETGLMNIKNNLEKSKEQDPVLFNLKKAGYPVVYARICQKKMQPIVYQESEYSSLGEGTKKKLVKYKNFTYNKPAYYMCPGNTYKYLNFIAGVHPAGYCLPCCFKTPISDRERKAKQIFESCTTRFRGPDDLVSDSRHILATNKVLDSGRIGHVPEVFKKITPRDTFMLGITQYSRSIFCPMLSVGAIVLQETRGKFIPKSQDPVDYFISELYERLKTKGKVFMPDLDPDDLLRTLGRMSGMQNDSVDWNLVITRALLVFWGITVIFCDSQEIDLPTAGSVTDKIVLVIKRMYSRESSVNNAGPAWYPVCKADENYFKTGNTNGIIFSLSEELDILSESLEHYDREQESNVNKRPGADAIIKFLGTVGTSNKKPQYTKYIGRKNKVYGISFEYNSKELFIVTDYSDYSSGKERISFDHPKFVNDPVTLKKFFDAFDMPGYLRFEASKVYRDKQTNEFIGVLVNDIQIAHTPIIESPFMRREWSPESRILDIDYDINTVNKYLLAGQSLVEDLRVARALYKYYLYDLVLMQVVREMNAMRDPEIKRRLTEAFSAKTPVSTILKGLTDIVPRGSTDFEKIVSSIDASRKNKTPMITEILATKYSWDEKYMQTSVNISGIKEFINKTCVRGNVSVSSFPNVYEPCTKKEAYCQDSILVVDCDDSFWEALPELIVDDMTNPVKKEYLIDRMYYDNIIDEYSYHISPNEGLFIKKK